MRGLRFFLLFAFGMALLTACVMGDGMDWTQVSGSFMKESKPYGPGNFRIRGDQFITLKITDPETPFKPMTQEQREDDQYVPEYTEPWMGDVGEILNRRSIHLIHGHVNGPIQQLFTEYAKEAAWWVADDWKTLYIATGWMDRRAELKPGARYRPQTGKLFKSLDLGKSWQQLNWPENQNISFLRFLDARRGYAVGWGPRIWRTSNGGADWTEIRVPLEARDPADERKQFNAVLLGKDGALRVAYFAKTPSHPDGIGKACVLHWKDDALRESFRMPGHTIIGFVDHQEQTYILSWQGYNRANPDAPYPTVVSWLDNERVVKPLREFNTRFNGYALYITPKGNLLVDGSNRPGDSAGDAAMLSHDGGKTWVEQNEGGYAQGGYYDDTTGTAWRVKAYSLYKRSIP
jgi:hypothetical protein